MRKLHDFWRRYCNSGDVVSDSGTDTGVVDTVNIASYISSTYIYTLGAGIENAWLAPEAKDADLTGNASNNTLTGNAFDNQLAGGDGIDTLNGGAGNDSPDIPHPLLFGISI